MTFLDVAKCVESACARQTASATLYYKRRLSTLATVAASTPLCGILGSIFGFSDAFQSIGGSHLRGRTEFSISFADSMLTTLIGLFVAVLALVTHRLLLAQAQQLAMEMRTQSSELRNRLAYHF